MTLFAWQKEIHWHDLDHQFLSNWEKKTLNKLFGALRGFKHELYYTGAMLYQLSFEAGHIGNDNKNTLIGISQKQSLMVTWQVNTFNNFMYSTNT